MGPYVQQVYTLLPAALYQCRALIFQLDLLFFRWHRALRGSLTVQLQKHLFLPQCNGNRAAADCDLFPCQPETACATNACQQPIHLGFFREEFRIPGFMMQDPFF